MKKFITLLLILALTFSLASCGVSPSQVVERQLKAFQSGEVSFLGESEDLGVTDELSTTIESKLSEFEYEITNEEINDTTARVECVITTYDFRDTVSNVIADVIINAFSLAFSGASDEEMDAMFNQAFMDELNKAIFGYRITTTFNLVKSDNSWEITELTDDNLNALTGGLYESILELDMFM